MAQETLRIALRRSEIGSTQRQRATLRGLGLRKIGDERVVSKNEAVAGMIDKVRHLIDVQEQ